MMQLSSPVLAQKININTQTPGPDAARASTNVHPNRREVNTRPTGISASTLMTNAISPAWYQQSYAL